MNDAELMTRITNEGGLARNGLVDVADILVCDSSNELAMKRAAILGVDIVSPNWLDE